MFAFETRIVLHQGIHFNTFLYLIISKTGQQTSVKHLSLSTKKETILFNPDIDDVPLNTGLPSIMYFYLYLKDGESEKTIDGSQFVAWKKYLQFFVIDVLICGLRIHLEKHFCRYPFKHNTNCTYLRCITYFLT